MILRESQLRFRAKHSARHLTADLRTLYLLSAREERSFRRERHFIAHLHVGCAAHDWHGFPTGSDVTHDEMVGLRMRIDTGDLRDGDRFSSLLADPFDLQTGHGESIGQTVEGEFDGHELTEPVERDFHLELPQKTQIVLIEQTNVVNPISAHGDAIDAHTKSESGYRFWIITYCPEHMRVNHARTENF